MVFIPQYFRVIRAETVRIKAEPFVESAKVIGAPTSPDHVPARAAQRHPDAAADLHAELPPRPSSPLPALGFLGFGIEPTAAAEWGYDLNKALSDVTSGIWWTALFPGLAIVLAVLGITLVGESLNDLADPRLRGRRAVGVRRRRTSPTTSVVPGGSARLPAGLEQLRTRHVGRRSRSCDDDTGHGDGRRRHQRPVRLLRQRRRARSRPSTASACRSRRGEVLAIVGESGSGKTVTAKTILGLLPETATTSGRRAARRPPGRAARNDVVSVSRQRLRSSCAAATSPWCSRSRRPRSTRSTPWAGRSPRACARTRR